MFYKVYIFFPSTLKLLKIYKLSFGYSFHSHKKQIVWKLEPNGPFYAHMLRTKLCQNPFFFTGNQNVNKPKSRAARTVYGLIFLLFCKIIVTFSSFLCQDANKKRSNCAIIGYNLSKKHKLTQYKRQNQESNYVDHKVFLNFYQELPSVQSLGDKHPNNIELPSWLVHVLRDVKATWHQEAYFSVS